MHAVSLCSIFCTINIFLFFWRRKKAIFDCCTLLIVAFPRDILLLFFSCHWHICYIKPRLLNDKEELGENISSLLQVIFSGPLGY